MNIDQAISALDKLARQKKINQGSVEKILDEILVGCVDDILRRKSNEGKSNN